MPLRGPDQGCRAAPLRYAPALPVIETRTASASR